MKHNRVCCPENTIYTVYIIFLHVDTTIIAASELIVMLRTSFVTYFTSESGTSEKKDPWNNSQPTQRMPAISISFRSLSYDTIPFDIPSSHSIYSIKRKYKTKYGIVGDRFDCSGCDHCRALPAESMDSSVGTWRLYHVENATPTISL